MTPSLWARVAAAIDRIVAKLTTEPLPPTISPGPLPVDGRPPPPRPVVIPFPAPPPRKSTVGPGITHPTPPPGPAPVPKPDDHAALIAATTYRMLEAHNPERIKRGLRPYLPSGPLAWASDDIVEENAANFAARGNLDHYAGGTSTPWTRMAARGVVNVPASENLAMGQADEAQAVADWLDEPDLPDTHRANVLSAEYSHLGGSVAVTADGRKVFACDYARLG